MITPQRWYRGWFLLSPIWIRDPWGDCEARARVWVLAPWFWLNMAVFCYLLAPVGQMMRPGWEPEFPFWITDRDWSE